MASRVIALLLLSSVLKLNGFRARGFNSVEGKLSANLSVTGEGATTLDCMSLTMNAGEKSVALGPQFGKYCGVLVVHATMSREGAELEGNPEAEVPGVTGYYLIENTGNSGTIADDDSRIVGQAQFGRAKSPSGKQTQAAMFEFKLKAPVECKDFVSNAIDVTEKYGLEQGHERFDAFWFLAFELSHQQCYCDAAANMGFEYGVIVKADGAHAKTTASNWQDHVAGDQFSWFRTERLQESYYASHPIEANHALAVAIKEVETLEAKGGEKAPLISMLGSVIEAQKTNGGLTEDDLWVKRARRKLAELKIA